MRHPSVAVLLAAAVFVSACSSATPRGDWVDFGSLSRPASPNSALACNAEICRAAEADRPPLRLAAAPEAVAEEIVRTAGASPEVRVREDGATVLRYVAVTRVLRFRDDVDVLVAPDDGGGSVVCVYSRSRVGYSDLGANQKRIDALFAALSASFPPAP